MNIKSIKQVKNVAAWIFYLSVLVFAVVFLYAIWTPGLQYELVGRAMQTVFIVGLVSLVTSLFMNHLIRQSGEREDKKVIKGN